MRAIVRVVAVACVSGASWGPSGDVRAAQSVQVDGGSVPVDRPRLSDAQRSFYNARYAAAATMVNSACCGC